MRWNDVVVGVWESVVDGLLMSWVVDLKRRGLLIDMSMALDFQEIVSRVRKWVERVWKRLSVSRLSRISELMSSAAASSVVSWR